ncbi:aminotransferase-like domain-containing protein [Mycobacterium sp. BMJ-28]
MVALPFVVMANDSRATQLAESLRGWIATAPPGARLPTTRQLVSEHHVSFGTVQQALKQLTLAGLIETQNGVGAFVRTFHAPQPADYSWQTAALGSLAHQLPVLPAALESATGDESSFHNGYPNTSLFPHHLLRSAFVRAARTDALVARPPTRGVAELRQWFAQEAAASTLAGFSPPSAADVIIVPGSQGALCTAFRALVGPDQPVIVESPTYWGAILAVAQTGARAIPIPTGIGGPDPEVLARAFKQTGARAFYAQPSFGSPTGALWDTQTIDAVLEVVRANQAFIVEDDSAHDFGIDAAPRSALSRDTNGHVVYVRSLTKSVSPAVRVAGLIARGPARKRILSDLQVESIYVSKVLQQVAIDVVTQPGWQTHIRHLHRNLRVRRDLLVDSLREHAENVTVSAVPKGGLNLWAQLPDAVNLRSVIDDCKANGVLVGPGTEYFPAEPTGQFIRMNYAGPDPESFPHAAKVISEAIDLSL